MPILFDITPNRLRAIAYEGGPPPEFLPPWREIDRLDLAVIWDPLESRKPADVAAELTAKGITVGWEHALEPRRALGAIDGFFHRHKRADGRVRGRARYTAHIAHASPGDWREVRKLYRLFGKPCHWRLRRIQVPEWCIEAVRL